MALKLLISILQMLTPDQQVDRLKEQYVSLRGKGAVVRAHVGELPVRQYISLLERGYRVFLERQGDVFSSGTSPRRLDSSSRLAWRALGGEPSRWPGLYEYNRQSRGGHRCVDAAGKKIYSHGR